MSPLSRRDFLACSSLSLLHATVSAQTTSRKHGIAPASSLSPQQLAAWHHIGRLKMQYENESVILEDGFLFSGQSLHDTEFSFSARTPPGVAEVQIWAAIRARDRDSRYIFGLRGGNNDHLYLARMAPRGHAQFFGISPLGFHPKPGQWFSLRAVAVGNQLALYLGDEEHPRISATDSESPWQNGGVCLGGGWLPTAFRDVAVRPILPGSEPPQSLAVRTYSFGNADRDRKRAGQRAAYRPLSIVFREETPRTEISLNGNWLFLPEQEAAGQTQLQGEGIDDRGWHVMDVPNFWTPTLTWLHAETGFPNLDGVSAGKGLSDRLYEAELERLDGYTFPWKETKGAWYRHSIELPGNIDQRNFELCFDAVAKICDIWVNGIHLAAHVGMFSQVRCNITHAIKPGRNVLAVRVRGSESAQGASDEVVGVAVTVPVTASMLHSLAHGMYPQEAAGIWQGVSLLVTHQVSVTSAWLEPRLDRLSFQLQIRNASASATQVQIGYAIRAQKDGSILYTSSPRTETIEQENTNFPFETPVLSPELWSPAQPNLYWLEVSLRVDGQLVDLHETRFGFRTFTVQGNRLLLNGKPFWLRGANHFPHALRPNDSELARRFMQLAREGNVVATRSHTAPFSKAWLDAADEAGMCVSYEGTWPWLMLQGEPPEKALLNAWKEEFASLIVQNRNHPSIILWTVNNEMKFEDFDRKNPELLRKKWIILNDMVRTIRSLDPTRPVVCDSSYCRREVGDEYENLIVPEKFDDGDIDDAHRYYGWYEPSFFHFFHGEFGNRAATPNRPLISQEMATGYPRNDDGHPVRFYLFKHYTPQALVGDEAYEHRNPAIFLKRQALMTKELAEALRRSNRDNCSGILHFAYVTWFQDVWSSKEIAPFVTYDALRKALQPVLISAELYSRQFYASSSIACSVCIANDSPDGSDLAATELLWELRDGNSVLAHGDVSVEPTAYYTNRWLALQIHAPATLPRPRVDATLALRLMRGTDKISANEYDLLLASHEWAMEHAAGIRPNKIVLFDPQNDAPQTLFSIGIESISALTQAPTGSMLIVAGGAKVLAEEGAGATLRKFVQKGGRLLLLHPRAQLPALYPEYIASYRDCHGEIVGMQVPESTIFSGIEPLDLSWLGGAAGTVPAACTGVYQTVVGASATTLANWIDFHGYLKTPDDILRVSGTPLVAFSDGNGIVIASEMLCEADQTSPIAGRLLANLLHSLEQADVFEQ